MEEDDTSPDAAALPSWYHEIFPAGPCKGFLHNLGMHSVLFVDRGSPQLVVTFDNLAEAGGRHLDREPWAGKFCRDKGWSHLSVFAQGPTWFRDQHLITFMEGLRDQGLFARFDRVAWAGTSMGGFGALAFSDLAPGSTVVAFSPQTTLSEDLTPWENRFQKGRVQDWTLPRSDAAQHLDHGGATFVIYDPMLAEDRQHIERLPQKGLMLLKGIGLGHKSALLLRRMEQLKPVMEGAIEGTLTQAAFREMIEGRKSLYLYRKNIEAYLDAKGQAERSNRFRAAFRRRRRAEAAAAPTKESGDPAPASIGAVAARDPVATIATPATVAAGLQPVRPKEPGNAWMIQRSGAGHLRYMSDRWDGRTIGYEERHGHTLSQTGEIVLGVVGLGHGVGVERSFLKAYPWHVLGPDLSRHVPRMSASSVAEIDLAIKDQIQAELPWMVAISANQPGAVAADFMADAPALTKLEDDITQAVDGCQQWGKSLFVDRVNLRLLTGAPDTSEDEAHAHYAAVGRDVQKRITAITGQGSDPALVVSQSCGSQTDGRSPVILAEGRLEIENPLAGFVVATPTYPYPMMADMPATHTPDAHAIIDTLEVLALQAVQRGQPWHCPSLQFAKLKGDTITAQFSAMSDLVLEDPKRHGFALLGSKTRITGVTVAGRTATISLSEAPSDTDMTLSYAWGRKAKKGTGFAANLGSLRDDWSMTCPWNSDITLHRFALAGCARVTRN